MNRARAKRRSLAWDRYLHRYGHSVGCRTLTEMRWRRAARRHRTTHAGVVAHREGRAL